MNIASFLKAPKLAVVGAALAALAPQVAQADAIAQSYLNISNFKIATSNAVTVTQAITSGDVSASIFGASAVTDTFNGPGDNFSLKVAQGPNAGAYTPGVALLGAATGNYAGSASSVSGNALSGTADAKVDNTVSLFPGGVGSSQGNTQLDAAYSLSLQETGSLSFSFQAEGFLRAMLANAMAGFPAGVNASYNWALSIFTDPAVGNAVKVFEWTPDGQAGGIFNGTETLDAFDLTDERNRLFNGDTSTGVQSGSFAASTGLLAAGNYTLSIVHRSVADARVVPEPAALSLLGLALLGAGVASRRRRS